MEADVGPDWCQEQEPNLTAVVQNGLKGLVGCILHLSTLVISLSLT